MLVLGLGSREMSSGSDVTDDGDGTIIGEEPDVSDSLLFTGDSKGGIFGVDSVLSE